MKYQHRFQVSAPLTVVADFHRRSVSMGAITPPPVVVQMHDAPGFLNEGDEMGFTMWLGPIPIYWRARIEQVTPAGFQDRQLRGPFRRWVHRHTFVPVNEQVTEVLDQVEAQLGTGWFQRLIGMGMWLNMPLLFAYRAWQTRRLLA